MKPPRICPECCKPLTRGSTATRHFRCHREWSRRTGIGQVAVGLETKELHGRDAAIEAARKRREEMGG